MLEKMKYLVAGVLAFAAVGLVACDEEDEGMNEWTDVSYCYVEGATLGNEMSKNITVVETVGLSDTDPVSYSFKARLNRPVKSDVQVTFAAEASGNIADILDNTLSMSAETVTIPAGKIESEEITLTVDPAFLGVNDAQGKYDPTVCTARIASLQSGAKNVKASTKTDRAVITLNKVVKPYENLASGTPSDAEFMVRTDWKGELGEGVEGPIEKLFDNSTGTDIAASAAPWEFTLDFGAEVTMLGAQTKHWGYYYAPRQLEILTSPDGSSWKSHGTLNVSGTPQNWMFKTPVQARYMKYRVLTLAYYGRTDITEFNLYVPKTAE